MLFGQTKLFTVCIASMKHRITYLFNLFVSNITEKVVKVQWHESHMVQGNLLVLGYGGLIVGIYSFSRPYSSFPYFQCYCQWINQITWHLSRANCVTIGQIAVRIRKGKGRDDFLVCHLSLSDGFHWLFQSQPQI